MKTQSRKAKKHHNQINEGFVRYSFSEYVHRQGDEQFDEFIGKALGGMWNKLTQNQRPGGAPRASAPDAAPAQAPAAQRPSAPAAAPAQKPSSFTPDPTQMAKIKSRNVHLTRVEKALGGVHGSLMQAKETLGQSLDSVLGTLQKSQQGEDMTAIAGMNQYMKNAVPSLKKQMDAKFDSMMASFDPSKVEKNLQGQLRGMMKDKWSKLDNNTPNDVSRGGGMISARETNPSGGAPRGSGSAPGSGSLKGQIDQSAGNFFQNRSAS